MIFDIFQVVCCFLLLLCVLCLTIIMVCTAIEAFKEIFNKTPPPN